MMPMEFYKPGEGHHECFSSFSLKGTDYGLTKEFNEILMGYDPQCEKSLIYMEYLYFPSWFLNVEI